MAASLLPSHMAEAGAAFSLPADQSLFLGLAALSLCQLALPALFNRAALPPPCSSLLTSLTALLLSVLAFASAVLNFPLALLLTLLYAPVVVFLTPTKSRPLLWLQRFALLWLHPLSLALAFACLDTLRTFPHLPARALLEHAAGACKAALMFAATDAQVYGNWLFVAGCVCLLPAWQCLWHVLWLQPHECGKPKTA